MHRLHAETWALANLYPLLQCCWKVRVSANNRETGKDFLRQRSLTSS